MNDAPASKRRRGDDGTTVNDVSNGISNMTDVPSVENDTTGSNAMAIQTYVNGPQQRTSTSSLPCPTLQLTGHTGSVYALKYSPSGSTLCSASFDMTCLLWQHRPIEYDIADDDDDDDDHDYYNVRSYGTNPSSTPNVATYHNFHVLRGHKNAVLDCSWFPHDNRTVVTASADQTLRLWDIVTQQHLRKYASHHTGIVNAVTTIDEHQFVSVSDDTSIILWDRRSKYPTSTYMTQYPVLAVAASTTNGMIGSDYQIYTAGIDPIIRIWDTRHTTSSTSRTNGRRTMHDHQDKSSELQQLDQIHGHTDTVTCLSIHPEGTHLLSNSMDQSLMQWDVRPFVALEQQQPALHTTQWHPRHVRTYRGHQHSAEKGLLKCSWSADGTFVTAGSSDTRVHIWDVLSGQELYDLPGHKGCVNTVVFHPTESTVIASGSSDKQIFVGELS
jgi:Prp8 binding protein